MNEANLYELNARPSPKVVVKAETEQEAVKKWVRALQKDTDTTKRYLSDLLEVKAVDNG
jgi:hypothetical protein